MRTMSFAVLALMTVAFLGSPGERGRLDLRRPRVRLRIFRGSCTVL